MIEFTDEELAKVNFFEPQKMKIYLNDLLTEKLAEIVHRIEYQAKQKYCYHRKEDLEYSKASDSILCLECDREWAWSLTPTD